MDLQKFMQAQFSLKQAEVKLPSALSEFGEVWTVRSMTASELSRVSEAEGKSEQLKALVSAMSGQGDKAEAIKAALGLGASDVPTEIRKRIEMLTLASVEPALGDENRDVAIKLADHFPTLFYELTNKILELTGTGSELGKPKRSTASKKSA
jgi:hypothetical protein